LADWPQSRVRPRTEEVTSPVFPVPLIVPDSKHGTRL
jgi:hypothetical protein